MGETPVEKPEVLASILPTKRDVETYAKAPVEVKEKIIAIANSDDFPTIEEFKGGYHESVINHVRSLIDPDNYTINTSSLTDADKDDALLELNTEVEALQTHIVLNEKMIECVTQKYLYTDSERVTTLSASHYQSFKDFSPELTDAERTKLIDLLISPIQSSPTSTIDYGALRRNPVFNVPMWNVKLVDIICALSQESRNKTGGYVVENTGLHWTDKRFANKHLFR